MLEENAHIVEHLVQYRVNNLLEVVHIFYTQTDANI